MGYTLTAQQCRNLEYSSRREWLLTNGIGGFAMGTAADVNTRRYHGLLVAAIAPPADRMVLLPSIEAIVQSDGPPIGFSSNQYPGAVHPQGYLFLESFCSDHVVCWRYRVSDLKLEKRVGVHRGVNASTIQYANKGDRSVLLTLRPLASHKPYHDNFGEAGDYPQDLAFPKNGTVITHRGVSLYLRHDGGQRIPVQGWYYRFEHAREVERGLNPRDDLFCPCELRYELNPGDVATIVASTEANVAALDLQECLPSLNKLGDQLRDSARHFLVNSKDRSSIIAGYPWFTDWGRDTMISLPGICLHTGEIDSARQIITDYAKYRKSGLIPNVFSEGEGAHYNTVDATLWMANAMYKTLQAEYNAKFAKLCWTTLEDVAAHHFQGTDFGIKVDPEDGLLRQGESGVQLTWMDAKVGDWVVTPRHGKPVEISALWINLLRVLEWLGDKLGKNAKTYVEAAEKAESSFETRFWNEMRGHYLDTVDPDDVSLRPNQLIAMALPFAVAKGDKAKRALDTIRRELVTTVGIRTLGPSEPGYRGRFDGPLPEMDASYHQGTVWPWLLGPYCTALVKVAGDKSEARKVLKDAKSMLTECGLGGITEVYDGDLPQRPAGCPWQAWSVAEILRAWVEDVGGD